MKRYLLILAAILGLSPEAHAANSTVAAMTPASALSGSELVYVVQGGADRKATPAQFATYMQGLITGDCSISGNTITCTKTGGVSFAPSATIDTTNASNISSGTLNTARLPAPFTSGTRSGNTSVFGTVTGTPTSGNCANWDASGNLADAGAACGTGGSSTITAGTTATSGITTNTFVTSTSNVVTNTAKVIPSGVVVGTTDTQTLTNKSISGAQINSGTVPAAQGGAGTINGALKGNGSGVVSQAACADLSNGTVLCSTAPGTGVATALGVNVGSAGSPVINGGALGTPSSGTLTSATGLPVSTGVSGLGTGVATALGVNIGTAGAPVVNGAALGTPSSGVATNLTGTASGLTAGTVTTNANLTGDVTSSGNATTYANVVPAAKGGAGTVTGALKANGSGTVSQAACADLSNGSASCSTDTTNATNIASGSLADARLTSNVPLKNGTNAFTSANSYSGSTTWTGNLITPIRTITAAGAVTVSATTDYFICVKKTSGAATTVNLPASPTTGLTYLIKDCKGDAATNNITVTPAAGNIDNSPSFVMNTNLQSVAITYDGVGWFIN